MSSSTSTPSLETVRKELEMTHQLLSLERSAFQRERELLEQQVRLTRAVATGKGRTQGAIGVFWDYENCSVSLQTNATRLVQTLRSHLEPHGPISFIRIYQDVAEQSSYAAGLRSGLEANGVEVRDCGRWGRKDVADHHIMADIALFALDNPPPSTICLMSGDKDFSYLLSSMRNRGYDILLFENQMGAAEALKASANKGVYKFRDLIKEAGTTADPTGASVNPPAAAPPTPRAVPRLVTATTPATNGRHRATSDPLSPAFLAAITSAHVSADVDQTSMAASLNGNGSKAPAPDSNPFTLGSRTKVPLPSSAIFSSAAPAAARKSKDRYENLIEVLRGMPKSRPLRSYVVPFLNRESWGAGVTSKDFFADAVDAGVIVVGKGEQLGMEWISLAPGYKIKPSGPTTPVPPFAFPTSPIKTTTIVPSSPVKPPQPTPVDLFTATTARLSAMSLSKDTPVVTTHADSPASGASASTALNTGPIGSLSNPYGALKEDEMRAESPPSSSRSATPASPAVRLLAKAAGNESLNGSPARKYALEKALENNPDPMAAIKLFQPLIQLLSTLPAKPAPLRYIVSALLRASHPKIYEAYGWKSYVARAEDEGIVDLGDAPARTGKGRKEWISLRDRFRESKHEMIVVESTDGGKVPPYAEKTAELFDPLIKALSKLPPASTANKTPATYVKTMSGQLAGNGLAFLDDVGVNCMADYFTLAKRMGVIRMGMGRTNDASSEWLALKKDYQKGLAAAAAAAADLKAESRDSHISQEAPTPSATKVPSPAPPVATITPATPKTPSTTPPSVTSVAPASPKQALSNFSDFSFSYGDQPAASGPSPATPAKRAPSPLARSSTPALSPPSAPAKPAPDDKDPVVTASPKPAAATPSAKPAADIPKAVAKTAEPQPKPQATPVPRPMGAADGSLFRSLEQQLDLTLDSSDDDSD